MCVAMPTRGIKRKYSEWEESVLDGHLSFQTDSYSFFRQSMLNISLEKFNKGRMMVEPSLRRYVLIANTLRVIQEEIRHESPCPIPALDNLIPGTCDPTNGNVISPVLPPDLENILLPAIEDDFSVSAAIACILKELESVLDESCPQSLQRSSVVHDPDAKAEGANQVGLRVPFQAAQILSNSLEARKEEMFNTSSLADSRELELISELVLAAACSENLPASVPDVLPELPVVMDTSILDPVPVEVSSHSNAEVSVDMETSRPEQMESEAPAEELRPSEAVFGSFEIMNSSYLNDVSLDDPFSDIDTSVFEKESQSIGSSLSNRLSASEDLWFPSSCSSPSYGSGQGMRETNDLDNIFEILVGS